MKTRQDEICLQQAYKDVVTHLSIPYELVYLAANTFAPAVAAINIAGLSFFAVSVDIA